MAENIPTESASDSPLIHPSGLIKTREEIEISKRAEKDSQETHYRELLLKSETRQAEAQHIQARASRAIVGLTCALLIVSLVGGFVSYLQFKAADKSANAAKDAAMAAQDTVKEARVTREESVKEAQRTRELSIAEGKAADERNMAAMEASNQQSRAALDASIEASRNDQRAWLGIVDLRLEKEPIANEDMKITFTIQNTGKTPAVNVRSTELLAIQPTEPDVPDWSQITATSNAIVFPGSTIKDVGIPLLGVTITSQILTLYNVLRVTPNAIWIRARMDYEDVFGRHHWIQTCGRHGPTDALDKFAQCLTGIDVDSPIETRPQSQK